MVTRGSPKPLLRVRILLPLPPKDTDIDTMSVFFLFAVSSVEDANIG